MYIFRRLRCCWTQPRGRLLWCLFLLSLTSLLILPSFIGHKAIITYMKAMHQHIGLNKYTTGIEQLRDNKVFKPPNSTYISTRSSTTFSATASKPGNVNVEVKSKPSDLSVQTTNSTFSQNNTQTYVKKYLIFLCDHKSYCYGLGDRQRAIVGVYFLAEVTNRTFGIIMTSPSPFTEFFKPNLVNWNIPASELENKSSVEIVAYGSKVNLALHEIDFNKVYPQDVVYARTNQKWYWGLLSNHHYRNKIPQWAKVPTWQINQVAWLRLMLPTDVLRSNLNEMLVQIAQSMYDEFSVSQKLNNSKCCEGKKTNSSGCAEPMCVGIQDCCNLTRTGNTTDIPKTCSNQSCTECAACLDDHNKCENKTCTKNSDMQTANFSISCASFLENTTKNISEFSRLKKFAIKYCDETRPVLKPHISVESIRQTKGYDNVDLNLVCVHIRLGHSATLPLENNVRNRLETVHVVWEFLKPYISRGHHIYLATDSQEVRTQAINVFGDRVHVSSVPIIHIALVKKGQDERSAFSLTLVEQLLLTTSCKVLVVSHSGFSQKAAQVRHQLGNNGELFIFKNARVVPQGVKWLGG